jgi:hypothetical protein
VDIVFVPAKDAKNIEKHDGTLLAGAEDGWQTRIDIALRQFIAEYPLSR